MYLEHTYIIIIIVVVVVVVYIYIHNIYLSIYLSLYIYICVCVYLWSSLFNTGFQQLDLLGMSLNSRVAKPRRPGKRSLLRKPPLGGPLGATSPWIAGEFGSKKNTSILW